MFFWTEVFLSPLLCHMFRIPAGYCFVEFADLATAEKCLHKINGKPLPGATPVSKWKQPVENQNWEGIDSVESVFWVITGKFHSWQTGILLFFKIMNIKLLVFLLIKLLKKTTDFYVNVWIKSRYRNVMMCFFHFWPRLLLPKLD